MAGALRKTMEYLGLAEADEHYDDYDGDRERAPQQETRPETEDERPQPAEVTHLPRRTPVAQVVREPEVGAITRITTIHPRTYNEAKNIGEAFRDSIPVILNLTEMDDADAKRLVDFAAGLAFGLHGTIERVTSKVFLLSPVHIEVDSATAPARAQQPLFNQS